MLFALTPRESESLERLSLERSHSQRVAQSHGGVSLSCKVWRVECKGEVMDGGWEEMAAGWGIKQLRFGRLEVQCLWGWAWLNQRKRLLTS